MKEIRRENFIEMSIECVQRYLQKKKKKKKKKKTATTTGFQALGYPSQGVLNKMKNKTYTEDRSKIMHKRFQENSSKEFC